MIALSFFFFLLVYVPVAAALWREMVLIVREYFSFFIFSPNSSKIEVGIPYAYVSLAKPQRVLAFPQWKGILIPRELSFSLERIA